MASLYGMKLVVHGHQLGIPRDARAFLRKTLVAPLRRLHDSSAAELTVGLDDVRPHKGGVDQRCRLVFRMPGARAITVESLADDVHAAILDAGRRLKRLVEREIGKQRSVTRKPLRNPLGRAWRRKLTRDGVAPDGTTTTL